MKNPSYKIVKGFNEGDKVAFAAVYNIHYNRVYNFVKELIKDREEAQDIVAETFIKLWKLHAHFNTNENIQAFLYITARNASMDYFRYCRTHREKKQEASYVLMQGEEEMPYLNEEIKIDVVKQIHDEIEKLPEQQRRIFKMAYLDGIKNEEIAKQLNLAPQTVSNQKTSALKKLRLVLWQHR